MSSGQTMVDYCLMPIFGVAIPFGHQGFKVVFFLVPGALFRCREDKKLSRSQLCAKATLLHVFTFMSPWEFR